MRPELHDLRRDKILRAAHAAFVGKGFTRTRMEEVARGARVAYHWLTGVQDELLTQLTR